MLKKYFALITFIVVIVTVSGWIACSKKKPTAPVATGTISGVVTDSANGTAISGVGITTNPVTSSVSTDSTGRFMINFADVGTYTVMAVKLGYINRSVNVTVIAGNTASANITLVVGGTANITWITVPAGNFPMGSLVGDPYAHADEYPQHTVYLDAYQISKFDITNAQYKAFIDAGGYSNSAYWSSAGWAWRSIENITEPSFWSSGDFHSGPTFPNYPVVGVSWYEACAFCNWVGGHLPTEAQWEKAARDTVTTNYWPWGSAWDAAKCNSYFNIAPDTFIFSSPVGFFTAGASPYGCYDMAGNVGQWCSDCYDSSYYSVCPSNNPTGPITGSYRYRVVRGGSFLSNGVEDDMCCVAYRGADIPDVRTAAAIGFRPAK